MQMGRRWRGRPSDHGVVSSLSPFIVRPAILTDAGCAGAQGSRRRRRSPARRAAPPAADLVERARSLLHGRRCTSTRAAAAAVP
jgi:hypothetical protein